MRRFYLIIVAILACLTLSLARHRNQASFSSVFGSTRNIGEKYHPRRMNEKKIENEVVSSIPLGIYEPPIEEEDVEYSQLHSLDASSPTLSPSIRPTSAPTPAPPPPCITNESDIAYVNGLISATQTFYNCLQNIADPMNIPTFYNGKFNGIMNIYSNIQLNNLHQIDAIAGTASLDFYLRLYWQDNRFNMPLFWSKMSKSVQQNGFELTLILQQNTSIGFWTPDIRFHDVSDLDFIVQTIRINISNIVFWSRHTVATYMQPKFKFDQYPSDEQAIHIRYGSYAYSQSYLKMVFLQPAITLNTNYDNSTTYTSNPEWTYDNSTTYYETYVSGSGFLNIIYHIYMKRQGSGIVVRLILPITLLLFLGGLTFWAEYTNRVDSTITLLLAVSALYIVILGNIPLVGYLTAIDRYVFYMFLMLIVSVILHQTYATIYEKADRWPLRLFYLRVIEALGRCSIFPTVTAVFLVSLTNLTATTIYGMIIIVFIVTSFILIREYFGVRGAFIRSMHSLVNKMNNDEIKLNNLSKIELLLFNLWRYKKFTTSPMLISEELLNKGKIIIKDENKSIKLIHLQFFNDLFGNSNNKSNNNNGVEMMEGNRDAAVEGIAMTLFKTNDPTISDMVDNPMRKMSQRTKNQSRATTEEDERDNTDHQSVDEEKSLHRPISARVIPPTPLSRSRKTVTDYEDSDDEQ